MKYASKWKQLRLRELKEATSAERFPLDAGNAHAILIRAFEAGFIHVTAHFSMRCKQRGFTVIDAETVIKNGKIVGGPQYCAEHDNWCFGIAGKSAGEKLEIRLALDPSVDYESPLVVLITGVRKERHDYK